MKFRQIYAVLKRMASNKYSGILDSFFTNRTDEAKKAIFHYCSYLGQWSRILVAPGRIEPELGKQYGWVEINLTPVTGHLDRQPRQWAEQVKPIMFSMHTTNPVRGDRDEVELPKYVRSKMIKYLGEELVKRLETEDFLSQIDLNELRRSRFSSGYGVELRRIKWSALR